MKIFFVPSKIPKIFKGKYVFNFCIIVLSVTLLSAQFISHIKNAAEPAMSQYVEKSGFSVTLNVSGNIPSEGAMVMVNGEEYAPLGSPASVIELERASVIEIFCENDADFSVSVRPSVGTTVIMPDEKAVCKKGMNYVCRCFFVN